MKKFLLASLLPLFLAAQEYKVVFDCSSERMGYLKSRMWLIAKTMDMFQEKGDSLTVALTMHGKCSMLASEDLDVYVNMEELSAALEAQKYLQKLLQRKGVEAVVCAMSLDANAIDKDSILEGIKVSPNSYMDTIRFQSMGYAVMTFK